MPEAGNRSAKSAASVRAEVASVCAAALQELRATTPGVDSATIATGDGFTVASTLGKRDDADKVAAMTSSMNALGAALARQTGRGTPSNFVLEASGGKVAMLDLLDGHERLVLTVVTNDAAILGHLLWSCRAAGERIVKAVRAAK
jgi:uncharacterized protein